MKNGGLSYNRLGAEMVDWNIIIQIAFYCIRTSNNISVNQFKLVAYRFCCFSGLILELLLQYGRE